MAPRSHARLGYPLVSRVVLPEHRGETRHGSRTRLPAEVRVRESGSVERAHDILARRIAADLARRTAPVPIEALSGHVAGQHPRERDRAYDPGAAGGQDRERFRRARLWRAVAR